MVRGIFAPHLPVFQSDAWLTPPSLLATLGAFDLDPCASDPPRPWPTAAHHYTKADNGLALPWFGRCWVNPPYGGPTIVTPWVRRLVAHGDGIALIFARVETLLWHTLIWPHAHAVLFCEGRLHFHRPDGTRAAHNAGAPSALIAFGESNTDVLARCGRVGCLVRRSGDIQEYIHVGSRHADDVHPGLDPAMQAERRADEGEVGRHPSGVHAAGC